jgi:hypothetical protein
MNTLRKTIYVAPLPKPWTNEDIMDGFGHKLQEVFLKEEKNVKDFYSAINQEIAL